MRGWQGARRGKKQGPSRRTVPVHLLPDLMAGFVVVGPSPSSVASRTRRTRRTRVAALAITALLLALQILGPSPVPASTLLGGTSGTADRALAGSSIAEPLSPLGAQSSNPAGLAAFTERAMGSGLGLAYGRGTVTADVPAGYHADNEVLVPFLSGYMVIPWGRWTFSISSMGTSGARFDYGARPNLGVNDGFFAESGMFAVPVGAAFRVTDTLWLGAQIIPLHGSTHLRYSQEVEEYPGAPTPFRFTVDGFGVQGMVGVTWKPEEGWALGLSVKPPGRVWAHGDTRSPGGKQDVDLEVEVPTEVALGITRALGSRWKMSYGLRFTDSSVLRTSYFRFEDTPSADGPYLSGARDEWKHSLGLQYQWSEAVDVLAGFSKANGIVSSRGINPSSFDSRDWRLNSGLRWSGKVWAIDTTLSYFFADSRRVSADEALVFPGKYESKPAYLLSVEISKKF